MGSQANGTVWELPEQRLEQHRGWGAQKCACTSSCERLPGARPHLGSAHWDLVFGSTENLTVRDSVQRAGVALPVMGQGNRTPRGWAFSGHGQLKQLLGVRL